MNATKRYTTISTSCLIFRLNSHFVAKEEKILTKKQNVEILKAPSFGYLQIAKSGFAGLGVAFTLRSSHLLPYKCELNE